MDLSHLLAWVSQAGTTLRELPVGVHGGAVGTLIAGLVLWLFGSKVLKPMLALAGAAIGGALGAVILPQWSPGQIGGFASHYVGLAGGVLVGILAALIFFRFAMAVAGGAGMAMLGALGVAAYLSLTPGALPWRAPEPGTPGTGEQINARIQSAAGELARSVDQFTKNEVATTQPAGGSLPQTGTAYEELKAELGDLWSRTPQRSQVLLIAGAGLGALIGILIGQIMPNKAAAVLTSMAGSAMALASVTWLARAFEAPFRGVLDQGPLIWLAVWAILAVIGVVVQLHRPKKTEVQAKAA